MSSHFSAFTLKASSRINFIKLEVGVSKKLNIIGNKIQNIPDKFWALWSTGVPQSYISDRIINKINLVANHNTPNVYLADFLLPNNIHISEVLSLSMPHNKQFDYDMIIGMDIISLGDMSLSNEGGKTMLSFRVPSLGSTDFVDLHKKINKPKLSIVGATHNQMCPCGSGKKYKNCCEKRN